jgi:hypothetical protein
MAANQQPGQQPGQEPGNQAGETYNPWTVVNLVFHHLADAGLHPVLGETGDPGAPAAELLKALGIIPTLEGDARVTASAKDRLAELRRAYERSLSQAESANPP